MIALDRGLSCDRAAETTTEEIPYSKFPYRQSHPDRLASIAALHGLDAPPPRRCRVLELGCGAGGNLIPLAYASPELRAAGVDVSGAAVADGLRTVRALQLANVALHERDLRSLAPGELGEHDYVVAHGVYTWVEPGVREALLAAIAAHLAPAGIAYVSYNAYPGGYFRRMLREMGLWHARAEATPGERVRRAQELYRTMTGIRAGSAAYRAVLDAELERFADRAVHSLAHDDLAEHMEPVWFADFAAHAARHGLAYVAEASPVELRDDRLPAGVAPRLAGLAGGDRVALAQYEDFVLGRSFRQSLLAHSDRVADPALAAARIPALRFAAPRRPDRPVSERLGRALDALAPHWPLSVGFDELGGTLQAGAPALAETLLEGVRAGALDVHTDPPPHAVTAGARPRASALARLQAAEGPQVTSLRHQSVHLDDPEARRLLLLLDGTRDRAAIRSDLAGAPDGAGLAPAELDDALDHLAALALLH